MTWTVAYFIFGLRNDTTLNSLHATTSCKNVETLPWKNDLSCFKSLLVTGLWGIILTSLPFKVVRPSFEYGLVLLATLIRGGGGITSTRSWTGHLCQNTVVSQVLLQLVVAACTRCNQQQKFFKTFSWYFQKTTNDRTLTFYCYEASEPTLIAFVAIVQILNQKSRYCGKPSNFPHLLHFKPFYRFNHFQLN